MNAVIVDIKGRQAAALREDGAVVRIRNEGYEIGQQLELRNLAPVRMSRTWKRAVSGAVAAALVVVAGAGTAYAMPYGTVTLDADSESSLVYTINCFDYVLDVQGGNESGETLLLEMDSGELRHHPVDRAVSATVAHLEKKQKGGEHRGGIRVSAEAGGRRHRKKLQEKLDGFTQSGGARDGSAGPGNGGRPDERHSGSGTDGD